MSLAGIPVDLAAHGPRRLLKASQELLSRFKFASFFKNGEL
jgi:hypothetical protein